MSQELWAAAIAELGSACIQRVELNKNTIEEMQPTFEWCLREMQRLLINDEMNLKNKFNTINEKDTRSSKTYELKKIINSVRRDEKFY